MAVLLSAPVLYDVAQRSVGADDGLAGLPWSLVVLYGSALVAAVCWWKYASTGEWRPLMRAWLMVGVVVWLFVLTSAYLQGQEPVGAAAFVPLSYFLILLKRPSRAECWQAADAFAWTIVVASALLLLLEVSHTLPAWYADHGRVGAELLPFDRANYWLPIGPVLGLEGRWGGLSGYPNIAGQTGALLLVYAITRPGLRRWVFAITGLTTLLLTDSRTSYAAAATGLCLLTVLPGWGPRYRHVTAPRLIALGLGLAMGLRVLVKIIVDPALTGRLAMWPEFLSLVKGFLPFGAGQRTIDAAIASGELPGWAHQGHNLFLDTFVRYGLVGLTLTVAFVGIAVLLTASPVRRELGVGLAIVVALIVSCLGDLGIDWTYPSEGLSFLLVGVMVAQGADDASDRRLSNPLLPVRL